MNPRAQTKKHTGSHLLALGLCALVTWQCQSDYSVDPNFGESTSDDGGNSTNNAGASGSAPMNDAAAVADGAAGMGGGMAGAGGMPVEAGSDSAVPRDSGIDATVVDAAADAASDALDAAPDGTTINLCLNVVCNDNLICSVDSCDPQTGDCVFDESGCCNNNIDCIPLGGGRACEDYTCVVGGTCETDDSACCNSNPGCNDNNACTTDSCNLSTGNCNAPVGVNCNDNRTCTLDGCDPPTGCTHSACGCDDDNDCADASVCVRGDCDYDSGTCFDVVLGGQSCNDANACTSTDVCWGDGQCLGRFDACAPLVPPSWICDVDWYGDGSCDCGCGVIDSDCPNANVNSCQFCVFCDVGAVGCDPASELLSTARCNPAAPVGWSCPAIWYGAGDGCDCGCGIVDSDCPNATSAACEFCSTVTPGYAPGQCSNAVGCSVINASNNAVCGTGAVPSTWTCALSAYDGNDGCHCGCGAIDPDCATAGSASCTQCTVCNGCGNVSPFDNAYCLNIP